MISAATIDAILSRVDIVQVVGERVALVRAGANHVGRCPFCGADAPAFEVNSQRRLYYCSHCREGGDAVTFAMKTGRVGIDAAIKRLAATIGSGAE